jgi:hypothetical protein
MAAQRIFLAALALAMTAAAAQEAGMWRAASKTAQSITGDVAFSETRMTINFTSFTIAQIRELTAAEIAAGFDGAAGGSGNLYRLSIPADKRFLHKNTLCGSEETQWVATYVSGRNLQVEFFSGSSMPVFTPEAIATTTSLCGSYAYVR